MPSGKWRPFCLGFNVLKTWNDNRYYTWDVENSTTKEDTLGYHLTVTYLPHLPASNLYDDDIALFEISTFIWLTWWLKWLGIRFPCHVNMSAHVRAIQVRMPQCYYDINYESINIKQQSVLAILTCYISGRTRSLRAQSLGPWAPWKSNGALIKFYKRISCIYMEGPFKNCFEPLKIHTVTLLKIRIHIHRSGIQVSLELNGDFRCLHALYSKQNYIC